MKERTTYIDKDGIEHCEICGEPIEAVLPENSLLPGKKRYRQCACERLANETERILHAERDRQDLIQRNKRICFKESRMFDWTFRNSDEDSVPLCKARKYVENWNEMKKNNRGCLFWGPVGTGKSYIAGCIANALLEQEVTVKMTSLTTIINDVFAFDNKAEYFDELTRYSLLILDDFGAERSSEYALEIVFEVINRRYQSGKPLILTTNLPLNILKSEQPIEKQRIYDRVLEMCVPIYVGGDSRRKRNADLKLKEMGTFLSD